MLFATHAVMPNRMTGIPPPEPVLAKAHPTTNEFLTMGDVFGLTFNAKLVVLSACESAAAPSPKAKAFKA